MRLAPLWPALLLTLPVCAQHEVRTPEFRLVSWAGSDVARQAAAHLERTAVLFADLGYRRLEPQLPLTVLLLPDINDLAPYLESAQRRDTSRGLSFIGSDGAFIALAWNAPGSPWTALAHEYAHLVDPDREGAAWFREGFAEYLSLLRLDEKGEAQATAAPHHVREILSGEWIPLHALLGASQRDQAFRGPLFYAQSWLLVDWLSSQAAVPLREAAFHDRLASLGSAAVEIQLVARASTLELADPAPAPDPATAPLDARAVDAWEAAYWKAELSRALHRWTDAQAQLDALSRSYPDVPSVQASQGALAMDSGRYGEAERLLSAAVHDPDATWRTHHRYAMLLLGPGEGEPRLRAKQAAIAAETALAPSLHDPNVRLVLAQAWMVAERWNDAARALRALASEPGWRPRAASEYAELLRRRQQATMEMPRPSLPATSLSAEPALIAAFPSNPPLPAPPPSWPPPGTQVLAGKIATVDCSTGGGKVLVLENRLFSMRFREPAGQPAKLLFHPLQWQALPCGARGWPVNVAYRPKNRGDGTRGDLVAVRF